LRRTSSGDGLPPKLPNLASVEMRRDADALATTVEGVRPQP
jgi:hypothetical protein